MSAAAQIICGIDPGYARLGWGLVTKTSGRVQYLAHGCIETKAGVTTPQRLLLVADQLEKVLRQHRPAVVGIEELFFAKNAKTAIAVAQARGVALLCAARACLTVVELKPMQVKQALTGYGRADKMQMQKMVKLVLHLSKIPKPDDAADALAIAITTAQMMHHF